MNILIVDDEIPVAKALSRLLRSKGYNVNIAIGGTSALSVLNVNDDIDVIISDYDMPGMDGGELLENIRSQGIDIPFAFHTGNPNAVAPMALKYSVKILTKPVSWQELENFLLSF